MYASFLGSHIARLSEVDFHLQHLARVTCLGIKIDIGNRINKGLRDVTTVQPARSDFSKLDNLLYDNPALCNGASKHSTQD